MSSKFQKENLVNRAFELLKYSIEFLQHYPKSHKFQLGDRIQNQLSDLLETYIRAFYSPKQEKNKLLREANVLIEIIRHYVRLSFQLKLINAKRYASLAEELDEMGRMTGAWINFNRKSMPEESSLKE